MFSVVFHCTKTILIFLSERLAEQNHPHQRIQTLRKMGLLQQRFLCVVCLKCRHLRLFPYILQGFLFFFRKIRKNPLTNAKVLL